MPSKRSLSRAELTALATTVRSLLASIAAGELSASAPTRHRLEGLLLGLEVAAGQRLSTDVMPHAHDRSAVDK